MFIMHMAFGGCLKAPPVSYGLTEDTGGHIAYVLGAAAEQARQPPVRRIEIVTRAFDDPALGSVHGQAREVVDPVTTVVRLRTAERRYLSKQALEAEMPALEAALLAHLARGPRPDVIHAHFADAVGVALAARDRWGIPVVYTPHSLGRDKAAVLGGPPPRRPSRRLTREERAIAAADAIVVSSRDEAERQLEAYGIACAGRVHRLPPGVESPARPAGTARARALLDPAFADPDRPLILAVARPVEKKNLRAIVEAFARTPGLRDRANLAILAGQSLDPGGRAVREGLRAAAAHHGLDGAVALPPDHRPEDVPSAYQLAAARRGVFVNPALHEPFGLTVLEAAAAGLPVVVTERGGPADIVATVGHGVAVDPADVAALGAACLETIADAALWDRRSAAATSGMGAYSWRDYARRSVRLYECLVRPRAAPRGAPRRLVVCDIDGTLTGDRAAAARFARWVTAGAAPFAVATGRSMPEARLVLERWGLPEPMAFITSVGSEIWHADGRGRAMLDEAFAASIAAGWDADGASEALLAAGAVPQAAVEQRRFKRSFLGDADEAARLGAVLRAAGIGAQVIASHERLIDVLPLRAGKGAAMAHLAATLGLAPADCVAAGDSGNDRCLLGRAGVAIVPGNALPELDGLRVRGRLLRTKARHAAGVLEGLGRIGLAGAAPAPRNAAVAEGLPA